MKKPLNGNQHDGRRVNRTSENPPLVILVQIDDPEPANETSAKVRFKMVKRYFFRQNKENAIQDYQLKKIIT